MLIDIIIMTYIFIVSKLYNHIFIAIIYFYHLPSFLQLLASSSSLALSHRRHQHYCHHCLHQHYRHHRCQKHDCHHRRHKHYRHHRRHQHYCHHRLQQQYCHHRRHQHYHHHRRHQHYCHHHHCHNKSNIMQSSVQKLQHFYINIKIFLV